MTDSTDAMMPVRTTTQDKLEIELDRTFEDMAHKRDTIVHQLQRLARAAERRAKQLEESPGHAPNLGDALTPELRELVRDYEALRDKLHCLEWLGKEGL